MAEDKGEKKKRGIAERIFKSIGLGLLCLVIIAGLIFQAPPKVITLLFVILLACTALPKRFRKWFWRSVGVIVLALIIWVFLPDDNQGWRPFTLDEELAALEAERAIPAEENAATIYNKLLANYDPDAGSLRPEFMDWKLENLTVARPWSSNEFPELAAWLKGQSDTIETLMAASKKDQCPFPIAGDLEQLKTNPPRDFEEVTTFWWSLAFRRPLPMRRWGQLLIRTANNDIAEGRIDNALKRYVAAVQMGRHMQQQSPMMDILVGITLEIEALEQIKAFLVTGDAAEDRLELLQATVNHTEGDWRSDFLKVLEREKLMLKTFMCAITYQTNAKSKVRFNRDPNSTMRNLIHMHPHRGPELSEYWDTKLTKAETIFCWFFVPSTPQKATKIVDKVCDKYYPMAEADFDWQEPAQKSFWRSFRPNYRWFAEMMLCFLRPNYSGFHDRYMQILSDRKGSQVILALRRFENKNGRWPRSLSDAEGFGVEEICVDPYNNGSFVYKPTTDGFRLYSKGKNNIDEGGKRKDGADDWPIWPPRSQITEEQDTDAE